MEKLNLSQ